VDGAPTPAPAWQGGAVDWDEQLFAFLDDLEQHADAVYDADREGELADRSRSAYTEVTLAGRLMATVSSEVVLDVRGVGSVEGVLRRVAADWCLVRGAAQDWVVPLRAVVAVTGASTRAVPDVAWSPVARLGLGSALRRLADSGERCRVHDTGGGVRDVVISRVGHDFVEATMGEGTTVLLALASVAAVQSRGVQD
jgi:hypothetical protein